MPVRSAAERIALRSRWVTIAGLVVLSVWAWLFLLREAGGGAMADTWPPVALMWAMMMIAMMLPSAAPERVFVKPTRPATQAAVTAARQVPSNFGHVRSPGSFGAAIRRA